MNHTNTNLSGRAKTLIRIRTYIISNYQNKLFEQNANSRSIHKSKY